MRNVEQEQLDIQLTFDEFFTMILPRNSKSTDDQFANRPLNFAQNS